MNSYYDPSVHHQGNGDRTKGNMRKRLFPAPMAVYDLHVAKHFVLPSEGRSTTLEVCLKKLKCFRE